MEVREETAGKVARVKELVDGGSHVQAACKKVGIASSQYYKYKSSHKPKRSYKKRESQPDYSALLIADEPRVSKPAMLVVGTPDQIAEVMRQYHG